MAIIRMRLVYSFQSRQISRISVYVLSGYVFIVSLLYILNLSVFINYKYRIIIIEMILYVYDYRLRVII